MAGLAKKILSYIRIQGLLYPGERIGVAVSGGADSVALLRVLLELRSEIGIVLSVVHFNHKIRGAEADADEQFVRDLAKCYGLELFCGSGDAPAFSKNNGFSLETAARELRYRFFWELLGESTEAFIPPKAQEVAEKFASAEKRKADSPGLKYPGKNFYGTAEAVPFQTNGVKSFLVAEAVSLKGALDKIATAHTMNDQAETVLMRMLRGAGTKGEAGIYPSFNLFQSLPAKRLRGQLCETNIVGPGIVRPLLQTQRSEIEAHLLVQKQPWREDASNRDLQHTRNRVRHELLPFLEGFNPAIKKVLGEAAEIARAEEAYWSLEVKRALPELIYHEQNPLPGRNLSSYVSIKVDGLLTLPIALQRRLLRAAAEEAGLKLDFGHVEALRRLVECKPSMHPKQQPLPGGWAALMKSDSIPKLKLWRLGQRVKKQSCRPVGAKSADASSKMANYEYFLPVPGEVQLREISSRMRTRLLELNGAIETAGVKPSQIAEKKGYNQVRLYAPRLLGQILVVRNWHPGERYWPIGSKSPKKIKELLQGVPLEQRRLWPVVVYGDEIIWMRGYPPAARFASPADEVAQVPRLLIEEFPEIQQAEMAGERVHRMSGLAE